MSQFIRFGIVGAIGFVVDSAVLYALLWCSFGYFEGRIISFLCAAYTTWRINRRFTFEPHASRSAFKEWGSYMVAVSLGGSMNLLAYRLVMSSFPHSVILPLLAVGAGSLAGMIVNFVGAKLWVFRSPRGTT